MLKHSGALPRDTRWLIAGVAVFVLALAIAWLLVVPGADWLARHDVGPGASVRLLQTARDAARGRLLTLGAGLFAAGALLFTALNFRLLQKTSQQTDQSQQDTYHLAEQGQVTDRYSKAVEQLSSDNLVVRIGAVYALERVVLDSDDPNRYHRAVMDSNRYHRTVMEVLTAFIREYSKEQWPENPKDPEDRWTRPDIQAAVTVVKRRNVEHDGGDRIDLYKAVLRGADLSDAKLGRAILRLADLTNAYLYRADFVGADLREATIKTVHIDHTADFNNAWWSKKAEVPEGWKITVPPGRKLPDGTLLPEDTGLLSRDDTHSDEKETAGPLT
jgi:hypothetical protein